MRGVARRRGSRFVGVMDISSVRSPGKQSKEVKWQSFVDDALLKTGQVTEAAIFGLDGVKWATSKNFNVRCCLKLQKHWLYVNPSGQAFSTKLTGPQR